MILPFITESFTLCNTTALWDVEQIFCCELTSLEPDGGSMAAAGEDLDGSLICAWLKSINLMLKRKKERKKEILLICLFVCFFVNGISGCLLLINNPFLFPNDYDKDIIVIKWYLSFCGLYLIFLEFFLLSKLNMFILWRKKMFLNWKMCFI